jgi:hypothetical protein
MLGCPLFPEARSAIAFAINMLIAVSRWASELNPSTLKKSQLFSVRIFVCRSNNRLYMPLSVQVRSLMAASFASSTERCIFSSSCH